jgi:hypothetical protein
VESVKVLVYPDIGMLCYSDDDPCNEYAKDWMRDRNQTDACLIGGVLIAMLLYLWFFAELIMAGADALG